MRRGIFNKFNRGEIDPRAMNREDVDKVNASCALMNNFLPIRLGPMMYRPGTRYIGTVADPTRLIPFVAATDDTAIIGITDNDIKVFVDDSPVTRDASNLTITNETFDSNITGWIDDSGAGATTAWVSGGFASLLGTGTTSSKLYQTTANSGSYLGMPHAVRIVILEAPVLVKIGEGGADSNDIFEGVLGVGVHSLLIIPIASQPTITLTNSRDYRSLVSEVSVEPAGIMTLPTFNLIGDLNTIRYAQSADVLFCATNDSKQFKIERRGKFSWSIVDYRQDDGPFCLINNTDITLTAAALNGNTTLAASDSLFSADSVGDIYRLTSAGQNVSASITAEDTGTNSIRVTGITGSRDISVSRSGSWVATVTLQRSTDDATWQDVESYTGNGVKTYNDGLDNQILYYRLHVKTGDYTSGSVNLDLQYSAGSIDGECRVTVYTSPTSVSVQVLKSFGSTDATRDWKSGEWSVADGYPTSVALYEGRLWWAGRNKIWSSVSDEFESINVDLEGDSAAIRRTIGFGPVDQVEWLAPSSRLIMGVASDEISVRSSSFGEVLSPTNTNLKSGSTQGVAPNEPAKVDDSIIFVQRAGTKILSSNYTVDTDTHRATDLTILNPDICSAGVRQIAAARQPETRIYVVLNDGEMRVYLREPSEDVQSWSRITMNGTVEDVVTLPAPNEDYVYLLVNRFGARYLERFSLIRDAIEEHFDSALVLVSPGSTISGLDHLEGQVVGVWADGVDRGTYTVSGGSIAVPGAYTNVVVGLPYVADFRSNKVGGYMATTVQGQRKRIHDIHLSMLNYWPGSLSHGPNFDTLEQLPDMEDGTNVDPDSLVVDYDETPIEFNGENEVDPRICLRATAPCTILSMTYGVLHDGDQGGE